MSAAQAIGMDSSELLATTRDLVEKSHRSEAELLVLLGEIDERKLYLDQACPSMLNFCMREYGFSEDIAGTRIAVARASRRFPAMLEALRTGQVHLAGLRVLGPHLTAENHRGLLTAAAGKTRREIEELVIRQGASAGLTTMLRKDMFDPGSGPLAAGSLGAAYVVPLAADSFRFHFTAREACRDKLREAQGLLRHRVPNGDIGTIVEMALEALITQVKKQRLATGRNANHGSTKKGVLSSAAPAGKKKPSRHIPNAIKREVFARDGRRCSFKDERGRRCQATSALEFDLIDGFSRTGRHEADRIRLVCRAHNQHAADKMYGRSFMDAARAARHAPRKIATGPPS